MSNAAAAYEILQAQVGQDEATGEWFEITQDQINDFADCTHDHQFIHLDAERATPIFGGTIAHGFLTLSMLVHLSSTVPSSTPPLAGVQMGINYGFDKVRFLNPVRSGSQVRGHFKLAGVEPRGDNQLLIRYAISVEIDGVDKPAIACEWLSLIVLG